MTKTVVLLSLLCLLVIGAAFGVIHALGRIASDLHRSARALDALVVRIGAVEQDLAVMSDDVYAIAEDVGSIAESLMAEEEGWSEGEAVRTRRRFAPPASRREIRRADGAVSGAATVKRCGARSRSAGGR